MQKNNNDRFFRNKDLIYETQCGGDLTHLQHSSLHEQANKSNDG